MVNGILFKDSTFDTTQDNNLMYPLTENTIILCQDYKLMDNISHDIINIINGKEKLSDYDCSEDDVGKAKYEFNFGLQRVIDINGQKIILCLEPAMIYRATKPEDIWFAGWVDVDGIIKKSVYPMLTYMGSMDIWNQGLNAVYKKISCGSFGYFTGSRVNI